MQDEPMTDKQYVKAGGGVCSYCGSDLIEGDGVKIDGPTAIQEVTCSACDKIWTDVYQLVGYARYAHELGEQS